jgi:hypothetical protein
MLDLVMRFSKKVGAFLPMNFNLLIKAVGKKRHIKNCIKSMLKFKTHYAIALIVLAACITKNQTTPQSQYSIY